MEEGPKTHHHPPAALGQIRRDRRQRFGAGQGSAMTWNRW